MDQNIILKFVNGQTLTAQLAVPFRPDQHEIEVILPDSGMPFLYSLHDLCCVLWPGVPDLAAVSLPSLYLEDVQTVTGDSFAVCTQEIENFSSGFYGIPCDQDSPYSRIFFISSATRQRCLRRPLGEILVQYCLLPQAAVASALEEQQTLRNLRAGEVIAAHSHIPLETIENTLQTAETNPNLPRNARVGDILVDAGLVSREEVEAAMAVQQEGGKKRIGELLIERGLINEAQMLSALATKFGMRFVDLENQIPGLEALAQIPRDFALELQVIPLLVRKGTVVVATAQPNDPTIGDSLRSATNRPIELVVARSRQIAEAIERFYPWKTN